MAELDFDLFCKEWSALLLLPLQVKVRGMRIELGEIESVLSKAPGVSAAIVKVVRHHQTQQDHLVAYTTPKAAPCKPMLDFAARHLPSHMVPVLVVTLAAHPVLPNGKVDMSAMPEPDWQLLTQETEYQAPQSRMQKLVAGVWEAVLGIKDASLHADFFKVMLWLHSMPIMSDPAPLQAQHFALIDRLPRNH